MSLNPRDPVKTKAYKAAYYQARKHNTANGKYPPTKKMWSIVVSNFKDDAGKWVKCKTIGAIQYRTFSYEVWHRMRARCTPGSSYQTAAHGYVGCTLHDTFVDFQTFTDWHINQVGFENRDYAIDKDILVIGNKVYGPDTCVLVPSALNAFFTVLPARDLPRGVRLDPRNGRFRAEMRQNNKFKYIGRFDTPEDASIAYQEARCQEAFRWAERLSAGEFVIDKRVIDVLLNWRSYVKR